VKKKMDLTVSKPVGRGRDGRLLGAGAHGKGLADDDPADGTPGADYGPGVSTQKLHTVT